MWGSRSSGGQRYRVRELVTPRVWGPRYFETPDVLTLGEALDKLAQKRKEYHVPRTVRVQLERHDQRRGWVQAAAETD